LLCGQGLFLKLREQVWAAFLFSGKEIKSKNLLYDLKKVNDTVLLERELENKYDRFAIKMLKDGRFLGYIAAYENIVMTMLMDQGVQLGASVSSVTENINETRYLDKVFSVQLFTKLPVPYNYLEINNLRTKRADDAVAIYRKGTLINKEKL
jgi:hypothetical protein